MAFKVYEGTIEDLPDTCAVHQAAMAKDAQWGPLMKNVKLEDELAWELEFFKMRLAVGDKKLFVLKETATSKIVAYTWLAVPGILTEEQKATATAIPPLPEGADTELMKEMLGMAAFGKKYGYDQEKHYHRKGISVHPEYQRRGLGSMISQHCSDIVDKEGGTTYCVARPIATLMFKKQGFELLGSEQIDMKKYGSTAEEATVYVLVRKPH